MPCTGRGWSTCSTTAGFSERAIPAPKVIGLAPVSATSISTAWKEDRRRAGVLPRLAGCPCMTSDAGGGIGLAITARPGLEHWKLLRQRERSPTAEPKRSLERGRSEDRGRREDNEESKSQQATGDIESGPRRNRPGAGTVLLRKIDEEQESRRRTATWQASPADLASRRAAPRSKPPTPTVLVTAAAYLSRAPRPRWPHDRQDKASTRSPPRPGFVTSERISGSAGGGRGRRAAAAPRTRDILLAEERPVW